MNNAQLIAQYNLTPVQAEVLAHVMEGLRNPEVGALMFRSEAWVKWRVSEVLAALECKSRCQAMAKMWRAGWELRVPVVLARSGGPDFLPVGVASIYC